jgi:hypothetical protein
MAEAMEIADGMVVGAPEIGSQSMPRPGVRPSAMADKANVTGERDDLASVQMMEIPHLGT